MLKFKEIRNSIVNRKGRGKDEEEKVKRREIRCGQNRDKGQVFDFITRERSCDRCEGRIEQKCYQFEQKGTNN